MNYSRLILLSLMLIVSLQISGGCSGDKTTDPPVGKDTTGTATAAYFGLTSGRVVHAHYYRYVGDSGRQFVIDPRMDEDARELYFKVLAPVTYASENAIPVEIWRVDTLFDTTQLATAYFSVKQNGLFWHGLSTCFGDLPLSSPLWVAPFPINDSTQWLYANLVPGRVDNCGNGLVSGRTLGFTVQGPTTKTVQGQQYADVYVVQVTYQQDDYEIWFKPNTGVLWAMDIFNAFTWPGEGFQVYRVD